MGEEVGHGLVRIFQELAYYYFGFSSNPEAQRYTKGK
jgi:hypothetical protein